MLWRKRIGGTVPTAMEAAPRGFYRVCGRPVIQSGRADFRATFAAAGVRSRIDGRGRPAGSLAAGRGAAATKRT